MTKRQPRHSARNPPEPRKPIETPAELREAVLASARAAAGIDGPRIYGSAPNESSVNR